ncbi:hypothetical protein K227x_14120 [Rubripirellula lacrimiformis]|uniref:Uncharacterized protein n=1 Tax=Rubripirellula lacrimiformis TaxID=1930273 RepID=A0A517N7B6_9BACT|nr:hypothetical protein K227x_14120 [Rubripirellula lacrimiformis]
MPTDFMVLYVDVIIEPTRADPFSWNRRPDDKLGVFMFHNGSPLVITTFGANRVGGNGGAALRAVSDLAFFDAIVCAAAAGSGVGVFSFRDSHCCLSEFRGSITGTNRAA